VQSHDGPMWESSSNRASAILAPAPMIRSALKIAAWCMLAVYGMLVGVLGGRLWFTLRIARSTVEFLRRRHPLASEEQFSAACAIVGALTLPFGVGANNEHLDFGEMPVGQGRRASSRLHRSHLRCERRRALHDHAHPIAGTGPTARLQCGMVKLPFVAAIVRAWASNTRSLRPRRPTAA
jgi:hypothetical protein